MERKETENESFLNPEEKVRVEKEQKGRKCILCRIDYGGLLFTRGTLSNDGCGLFSIFLYLLCISVSPF